VQSSNLDDEDYVDMFGGNVEDHEDGSLQHEEITISGMKYNLGMKKHWYKIQFFTLKPEMYSTPMLTSEYFQDANFLFNLKLDVPPLSHIRSDFAYKVTYVGKSKNPNGLIKKPDNIINSFDGDIKENDQKNHLATDQQSIRIEENLENLIIFPNPNNGSFTVKSNQKISKIEVYNINGEMLEKFENIDQSQQEFNLQKVSTGFYLIKVFLGSTYEIRKISIL
jgi:hypothetical protein